MRQLGTVDLGPMSTDMIRLQKIIPLFNGYHTFTTTVTDSIISTHISTNDYRRWQSDGSGHGPLAVTMFVILYIHIIYEVFQLQKYW